MRRVETIERTRYVVETDASTARSMGAVRRRDTPPELRVRAALRDLGVHYRIANSDLPGSPDVANRTRRWAVFVHGCFWHHHPGCARASVPVRNREFWIAKFVANARRDRSAQRALRSGGYRVVVVWECETRDRDALIRLLVTRLRDRVLRAGVASGVPSERRSGS